MRVLILHRYGGVYTDLDSEALRPLEPLFASKQVVVGRMGHDFKSQQSIPNAFMASSIDQHFWLHFLEIIQKVGHQCQAEPALQFPRKHWHGRLIGDLPLHRGVYALIWESLWNNAASTLLKIYYKWQKSRGIIICCPEEGGGTGCQQILDHTRSCTSFGKMWYPWHT